MNVKLLPVPIASTSVRWRSIIYRCAVTYNEQLALAAHVWRGHEKPCVPPKIKATIAYCSFRKPSVTWMLMVFLIHYPIRCRYLIEDSFPHLLMHPSLSLLQWLPGWWKWELLYLTKKSSCPIRYFSSQFDSVCYLIKYDAVCNCNEYILLWLFIEVYYVAVL